MAKCGKVCKAIIKRNNNNINQVVNPPATSPERLAYIKKRDADKGPREAPAEMAPQSSPAQDPMPKLINDRSTMRPCKGQLDKDGNWVCNKPPKDGDMKDKKNTKEDKKPTKEDKNLSGLRELSQRYMTGDQQQAYSKMMKQRPMDRSQLPRGHLGLRDVGVYPGSDELHWMDSVPSSDHGIPFSRQDFDSRGNRIQQQTQAPLQDEALSSLGSPQNNPMLRGLHHGLMNSDQQEAYARMLDQNPPADGNFNFRPVGMYPGSNDLRFMDEVSSAEHGTPMTRDEVRAMNNFPAQPTPTPAESVAAIGRERPSRVSFNDQPMGPTQPSANSVVPQSILRNSQQPLDSVGQYPPRSPFGMAGVTPPSQPDFTTATLTQQVGAPGKSDVMEQLRQKFPDAGPERLAYMAANNPQQRLNPVVGPSPIVHPDSREYNRGTPYNPNAVSQNPGNNPGFFFNPQQQPQPNAPLNNLGYQQNTNQNMMPQQQMNMANQSMGQRGVQLPPGINPNETIANTVNPNPNRYPENESWAGLKNLGLSIKDALVGTNPNSQLISNLTPIQQYALNTALMQYFQSIQDPNQYSFQPIERQARYNFGQNTTPNLMERFTSMGAQRSSAFPQMLGQAKAGLETDLAAGKAQHNIGQQGMMQNLLQLGIRPQIENIYQPGQPGMFQGGINKGGEAASKAMMAGMM